MDEEFGLGATFIPDDAPAPAPTPAPVDPERFSGAVSAPLKMSQHDLDLMARMVMMESGGEPDEGQRGVASVILNRAQSGRYGEGISGVITRKGQFEPWGNAKTRAAMMAVDTDSPRYQRAMANTLAMVNGDAPDPTNGATHFLNKATSAQRGDSAMRPGGWGNTGADQIKIGNHTFMKADAGAAGSGRQAAVARAQAGPRASVMGAPDAQTPGIGRSERVPTPPPRPAGILTGDSEETAKEIDKQLRAGLGKPETPKPGLDAAAGLGSEGGDTQDSPLRGGGGILTAGPGGATKNILPPLGQGAVSMGQGILQAAQPTPTPAAAQAAQTGTIAPLVPKQLQAAVPLPPPRPPGIGETPVISAPPIAPPDITPPQLAQASPLINRNQDLPGFGTPDGLGRTFGTPNVGARPSLGALAPPPVAAPPASSPLSTPAPAPMAPPIAPASPIQPPQLTPRPQVAGPLSPPPLDPDRFARDAPAPGIAGIMAPPSQNTSLAGSAAPGPGGGKSFSELAGILSGGFNQASNVVGGQKGERRRPSQSSSPELQTGSLLQGGILAGQRGGIDLSRYFGLLSGRGV
jgi:spore germination cell wall hydrolase CwlJ-like protein